LGFLEGIGQVQIRSNVVLAGKVCLVVILLLVGLTFFGCAGIKSSPEGGSGATIADGTLFLCPTLKQAAGGFSCAAPSGQGKLVAVNTSDGSRLWEVALEASRPAGGGFGCAQPSVPVAIYGNPAVAGDLVYVGGYNGKICAISASTHLSKDAYVNESNHQPIVGGPVVALGKVYLGCADGKVYALDAASLDKEWEFQTGGKIWSTPAIDGDTLYIGSFDKKLYALNASDGSKKWEFSTDGAIISTPLVDNGTVYVGSFDRHLYAVDASDGSLKWKFMADSWFWAKPVICNNVIYAGCLDNKVYALDAKTGDKISEFDLGSPIISSPVLVDSLVIIVSEEGKVFALDTGSNQPPRELADLKEMVYAPLCASNGVIYIYGTAQNLYALNAGSGARLWSQTIK